MQILSAYHSRAWHANSPRACDKTHQTTSSRNLPVRGGSRHQHSIKVLSVLKWARRVRERGELCGIGQETVSDLRWGVCNCATILDFAALASITNGTPKAHTPLFSKPADDYCLRAISKVRSERLVSQANSGEERKRSPISLLSVVAQHVDTVAREVWSNSNFLLRFDASIMHGMSKRDHCTILWGHYLHR